MRPVQPGWVIVPAQQETPNEWFHLVGWTEEDYPTPVIATHTGIRHWRDYAGEDPYCVATLDEWNGPPSRNRLTLKDIRA